MKYEHAKKLVDSGKSKLFENWNEIGNISIDEFLAGYKWLSEDPLDEKGRISRDIGLEVTKDAQNKFMLVHNPEQAKIIGIKTYDSNNLKGKMVKLNRTVDPVTGRVEFFHNGKLWNGDLICNIRTEL